MFYGIVLAATLFIAGISCYFHQIRSYIDAYAISRAQQMFGSMPLAQEQEQLIKSIAVQMGAPDNIIMRRMNVSALRVFGYHNAFSYFPQVGGVLPISTIPFLFVSEGFFEDLTPEEQVFLIGHELAHIKERHVLFLMPCAFLGLFILLFMLFIMHKRIKAVVYACVAERYQRRSFVGVMILSIYLVSVASGMFCLAYRRHIERDADYKALEVLHSYDGCLKLLDRWQAEFKIPEHTTYFVGLMTDHPSCAERRVYCLALQNQYNQREIT